MPVIGIAIVLLLTMVIEALGFTATTFVFLDFAFWDGWNAMWGKPVWLFLWALITVICSGLRSARR